MGPVPKLRKRTIEEIRQSTQEARNRAYERAIDKAHDAIEKAASEGDWGCYVWAERCFERSDDLMKYFAELGYSVRFDEEDSSIFIGWR